MSHAPMEGMASSAGGGKSPVHDGGQHDQRHWVPHPVTAEAVTHTITATALEEQGSQQGNSQRSAPPASEF